MFDIQAGMPFFRFSLIPGTIALAAFALAQNWTMVFVLLPVYALVFALVFWQANKKEKTHDC